METVFEENPCGGIGRMKLEKILDLAQMNGKCGLYARVTLPLGVKRPVKAGDSTWTPDGSGHGLSNAEGTEDLVFMALIINS